MKSVPSYEAVRAMSRDELERAYIETCVKLVKAEQRAPGGERIEPSRSAPAEPEKPAQEPSTRKAKR